MGPHRIPRPLRTVLLTAGLVAAAAAVIVVLLTVWFALVNELVYGMTYGLADLFSGMAQ